MEIFTQACQAYAVGMATLNSEVVSFVNARVNQDVELGHWEGDLLSGSANSYMVTLVERQTRYVMLAKVTNKDTHSVVKALIRQARKLPNELCKALSQTRVW